MYEPDSRLQVQVEPDRCWLRDLEANSEPKSHARERGQEKESNMNYERMAPGYK